MQNLFTTRNLIIAVAVILLVGGGIILYFTLQTEENKKEGGGIGEFFSNLFPGGGERELTPEEKARLEEGQEGGALPPGTEAGKSESFQLVREAVSGATLVKNPSTGSGRVRYIERASGHLFEMDLDGGNKNRISNTTIPAIFEVIWSSTGNRAILKYYSGDGQNIFSANFTGSSTQGIFLSPEIKSAAFSPRGDRIAYVLPSGDGAEIITATPENKTQTLRLKSQSASWGVLWPDDNNLYLLSLPSAYLDGFLYRLNLSSGSFTKILGPKAGILASVSGSDIFFSEADLNNRSVLNSLADISKGSIKSLALKTLPEKCAWSKKAHEILFCGVPLPFPGGIYPDDWYKGKISFTDVILKINTQNGSASSILIPEAVDIVEPFLSEDEALLFFVNKKDGSLWRVKLE